MKLRKLSLSFLIFVLFVSQAGFSANKCKTTLKSIPKKDREHAELMFQHGDDFRVNSVIHALAAHKGGAAVAHWARQSSVERSKKRIKENTQEGVILSEVVVIGGGIASSILVSNLVKRDPAMARKVLVLDAAKEMGSANYNKSQFDINSGYPLGFKHDVQPNRFPGAVLSPDVFNYYQRNEDRFPNPKFLADTAAINLRVQDVMLMPNAEVQRIETDGSEFAVMTLKNGRVIVATKLLAMPMGFGSIKTKGFDAPSKELIQEEKEEFLQSGKPQIWDYRDLLKKIATDGTRWIPKGAKIGVIGGKHGGAVTFEALLKDQAKAKRDLVWFDQPASTGYSFLNNLIPGGSTSHNRRQQQLFESRYQGALTNALDNQEIKTVKDKVSSIRRKGKKLELNKSKKNSDFDIVVLATGANSAAFELLDKSFGSYDSEVIRGSASLDTPSGHRVTMHDIPIGKRILLPGYTRRKPGFPIYVAGASAQLELPNDWMSYSITGSPQSINALGGPTASLGEYLRKWLESQ